MSKYKAGLHKDVSAIFNGVSLPNPAGDASRQNDIARQSSAAIGHQGHSAPKPSVPEPPARKPSASQPSVQKPSVSQPPTQKLPASQSPVQKPSVLQPPTQGLPALQPPVRKSSASQPPVQKPPVSEPSAPKSPVSEPPAQKSSIPSHMTSAKPKASPPPQSQPKETPAKQPKAGTAAKTAGRAQWQRKLEEVKSRLFTPQEGGSPTKQKVMVIAMPVLFIVLIVVFIRVFSTSPRRVTGPGKAGQTKAAASSVSKAEWQAPKPYPETLRDPMQFGPARGQAGGTGELIVKGIVYSEDNPTAVVGDQVVHQGDKISDVVITKINENSVEFEANGKKWMQNVQR
jgi:hypothetical protein